MNKLVTGICLSVLLSTASLNAFAAIGDRDNGRSDRDTERSEDRGRSDRDTKRDEDRGRSDRDTKRDEDRGRSDRDTKRESDNGRDANRGR